MHFLSDSGVRHTVIGAVLHRANGCWLELLFVLNYVLLDCLHRVFTAMLSLLALLQQHAKQYCRATGNAKMSGHISAT